MAACIMLWGMLCYTCLFREKLAEQVIHCRCPKRFQVTEASWHQRRPQPKVSVCVQHLGEMGLHQNSSSHECLSWHS